VNRDAAQRRQEMLSDETAVAREALDLAFDKKRVGRQFAASARGVRKQRSDAAFDVDRAVGARSPGCEGELVKLLLGVSQRLRNGFQHVGAFMEVHRPQRLAATRPPPIKCGGEIEALGINQSDRRARGRVAG